MAKTSSAMRRAGNPTVTERETFSTPLRNERAFASFAPTPLHPDGEAVVSLDSDGRYKYLGRVPNWTQIRVDKDSAEYKRERNDYNIRLSVHSDGSVTVEKGGLYDRKKTYKTKKAFLKDAEKRMDSRSSFVTASLNSKVHGGISQIEAEKFKSIVRNNTKSMAIKKMNSIMQDTMKSIVTRYTAAQDAKEKLKQLATKI